MQFDMPLETLREYRPEREEPGDFDAFWASTLAEARSHDIPAIYESYDAGLVLQDVYDITFSGFGGQSIKAWLLIPKHRSGPVPCVVEYIGYGGGRGFPFDWLVDSSAGFAHFIMDTRGQGSVWLRGDTPDPHATSGPAHPGFMTRGIDSADDYYYRRLITDAVRAVEAARSHPDVDGRVVVTGGSQGGGLALAVGGLVDDLTAIYADQPFLCHFRRAVALTDSAPYSEIAHYLSIHQDKLDRVFRTLSYVDGVNFAARAAAPARFTAGLMDVVCPPSTVFAAYNHYAGPKGLSLFPYNGHDMGNTFGRRERLRFLREMLA